MAFKETQETHKRIKDISEAEHVYEAREKDVDPEKAHFLAIYENLARSKISSYEEYLEDKEDFLEKEYARRQSIDKVEDELNNLESDRARTEKISGELKSTMKDRLKYLDKKVTILSKLKIKVDVHVEDISKLKSKNKELEEKIERLTDNSKHRKLKEKYEGYIRENQFDIKDKEGELETLRKQNVEEKFKRTWEDIWAIQKRGKTIPNYDVLGMELKMRLKEDQKEVDRRATIRQEFEEFEKSGVTPDSLRGGAERGEVTLSRLYDEQEDIAEAIKEKKKFKLIGKVVAGSAQTGLGMMKVLLRRGDKYQNSENMAMGLYKLRAAAKGIIRNRPTLDKGIMDIPSLKEVQQTTELYKKPKEGEEEVINQFRHEILYQSSILVNEAGPDQYPKPEDITPPDIQDIAPPEDDLPIIEADESLPVVEADESLPEIEADESIPVVEAESEPVKVEEKDDEISIADKVSGKIFDGMVREYTKYLESNSDDDKGINAFFRAMKKSEIKPSLIKKEGRYIKRWMKSIQKWAKDVEGLDKKEVKHKLSNNFFSTIVKIHSVEDLKKTGVVRDITGDMFKQFLLIRRLQALKS